jgi:hypothetical protein
MKRATRSPFESGFGFKSPGFAVDSEGNLTARSFNITQTDVVSGVFDFVVTDDQANFYIENQTGPNPAITLARGRTYTFRLDLTAFSFFIKRADGVTDQVAGLTHSSNEIGVDAQGKSEGVLSFTVPVDADDTLFYTNQQGTATGTITVIDPVGLFSTLEVTNTDNALSSLSGALTVAGGVGIAKDLYIGGELNIAGVGIPRLSSETNLELNANNKIILEIDNSKIGEINSQGLTVSINNSSITGSTIDSTVIGGTTPAQATFTSATVENEPVLSNDVTKKSYVDTTSVAFAIALGS